ncbi:MAG: class I SAM-dependent methyltransferase [Clostridia bacterium]|nr:class I SAM-dependent methyltransferase [Clostridia bacterium]
MDEELFNLRKKYQELGEPILRDKTLEILLNIVRENKPNLVLEIGTSVGLTATAILLENPDAKITTIEIEEEKVKKAREHFDLFKVGDRAKTIIGDAGEIIPILSAKYDLILLDGPKGHYYEYLDNLLAILNRGGILFADDVLFHGYIKGKSPKKHNTIKNSILSYLDAINSNKDLQTQLIEIEDGISITRKIR